jgi:hypothetical protein
MLKEVSMGQDLYYVAQSGQPIGPFSIAEIAMRIRAGTISLGGYFYDTTKADWLLLSQNTTLMDHLEATRPSIPLNKTLKNESSKVSFATADWFVLKADNRYGPFSYLEVVHLIQEKSIAELDYVWRDGLVTWHRLAVLDEFQHESIRVLRKSAAPEVKTAFLRRKHARARLTAGVLAHDNKRVFHGTTYEIGVGGAGISMDSEALQPGDVVQLHFKPSAIVPTFNAKCEVVSKRISLVETTQTYYGVRFLSAPHSAVSRIFEYTQDQKAA